MQSIHGKHSLRLLTFLSIEKFSRAHVHSDEKYRKECAAHEGKCLAYELALNWLRTTRRMERKLRSEFEMLSTR